MQLKTTFSLGLVLDSDKFDKIFSRVSNRIEYVDENEFVDNSIADKGITVYYRDSQYKKKIKIEVNTSWVSDSGEPDKLVRKLEKRIEEYFNSKFRLNDFTLKGMNVSTDIDVRDREKVSDYVKVLQRVGRVKGFSPSKDNDLGEDVGFCLSGNSNGIEFMIFDLERLMRDQLKRTENDRKQLKEIIRKSAGLLRSEVRLVEPKTIRAYTDESDTASQIADLFGNREKIFLDTFTKIIPFGDFYKKTKASDIIREKVSDTKLRRRCLRMLALIPEKKSLLLAQKELNCRKIRLRKKSILHLQNLTKSAIINGKRNICEVWSNGIQARRESGADDAKPVMFRRLHRRGQRMPRN